MMDKTIIAETSAFLTRALDVGVLTALLERNSEWSDDVLCASKRTAAERFAARLRHDDPTLSDAMAQDMAEVAMDLTLTAANGFDTAVAARKLASERIAAGNALPPYLAGVALAALRDEPGGQPSGKGPSPYANDTRDFAIAVAVRLLAQQGFRRTRNAATSHRESACSIVAQAFNMTGKGNLTEDAVAKIDARLRKWQGAANQ